MADAKETRLLERALSDPRELKKKLVLAIALAPPKSARPKRSRPGARSRGK